ncbi:uncharacterized protein LOC122244887 [Penaeus japonicus]|uniref:uncharacterized protein LOC122244887 n=1 Tax=Penaeus japonicus TaxID=27405 RepID=UPI001C713ED1|nr:uncharacterized protein LOC122244887 [Penaeus japonicus]
MSNCLHLTYRGIVYFGLLVIVFTAVYIYRYTSNNEFSFTSPEIPEIKILESEAEISERKSETQVNKTESPDSEAEIRVNEAQLTRTQIEENTNGDNMTDDQYFEMVKQRFDFRKEHLQKQCAQDISTTTRALNKEAIYYINRYRTFFCVSAKGGSTTWKTHMLKMKGKPGKRVHKAANEKLIRAK